MSFHYFKILNFLVTSNSMKLKNFTVIYANPLSIARLKLCSAQILEKLMQNTVDSLRVNSMPLLWTDPKVVLNNSYILLDNLAFFGTFYNYKRQLAFHYWVILLSKTWYLLRYKLGQFFQINQLRIFLRPLFFYFSIARFNTKQGVTSIPIYLVYTDLYTAFQIIIYN